MNCKSTISRPTVAGAVAAARHRLIAATAAATAVAAAATAPLLTLFIANRSEFTLGLPAAAGVAAIIFVAILAAATLSQLPWRSPRGFTIANALTLGTALAVWTQISFFSDFFAATPLYRSEIDGSFYQLAAFNILFIAALFAPLLIFRGFVARHIVKLAAVVAAAQLVSPLTALRSGGEQYYDFTEYSLVESGKFTFASRDNVLLIVVDCLGEAVFKEELKHYPELAGLFADFTCFDRMVSPVPWTMYAVPAMLTGVEYPERMDFPGDEAHAAYLAEAFASPDSLFRRFRAAGYRAEGYPYLLKTIRYSPDVIDNSSAREEHRQSLHIWFDVWLNKLTPFFLKPLLLEPYMYLSERFITPQEGRFREFGNRPTDLAFFDRLGDEFRVGGDEKIFKYFHLQGAHVPIELDEKLNRTLDSDEIRQLRGSLRNLEELFRRLRESGLYDNALIVVTGDHTPRYRPEIVTLIKRPGETRRKMAVNSVPGRVSEIVATILAEKGLAPRESSLFSRPAVASDGAVRETGGRRIAELGPWRETGGVHSLPAAENEVMTRACRIYQNRIEVAPSTELGKLTAATLLAVDCASGREWTTGTRTFPPEPPQDCCAAALAGLPDGVYRVYFKERGVSRGDMGFEEGSEFSHRAAIPRFLVVADGRARLEKFHPAPPAVFEFDQTVAVTQFGSFPELEISGGGEFISDRLRCGEGTVFTANLPDIPADTEAELRLDCRIFMPFPVVISFIDAAGNEIIRVPISEFGERTIALPLAPGRAAGKYSFGFVIESMFPNRHGEIADKSLMITAMKLERRR